MFKSNKLITSVALIAIESMLSHPEIFKTPTAGMSESEIRNDPNREKTESDLRHIEAARLKRERKQKKKDEQKAKS